MIRLNVQRFQFERLVSLDLSTASVTPVTGSLVSVGGPAIITVRVVEKR